MQLHLHPTRHEALTASETVLTRWSLESSPASILAQYTTAPESVFRPSYSPASPQSLYRGITSSPGEDCFVHRHLTPTTPGHFDFSCDLAWRSWDDLSLVRTRLRPPTFGRLNSLACSPDGRWLVMECIEHTSHAPGVSPNVERLFLLDGHTGEVISRHDINAFYASSLAFDPTSTFVAASLCSYDGESLLTLWRLTPAAQFIPRPATSYYVNAHDYWQDEVSGSMALTLLKPELDQEDIKDQIRLQDWSDLDIPSGEGLVIFSPQGQVLLFSLNGSLGGGECIMIAYAVPSGRALWRTHPPVESSGQAIFHPDGRTIFLPEQGGDLLVYRAENGALVQRLPTGLSKPVQALAFDHDGKTLWLATEEGLVQYQPQR